MWSRRPETPRSAALTRSTFSLVYYTAEACTTVSLRCSQCRPPIYGCDLIRPAAPNHCPDRLVCSASVWPRRSPRGRSCAGQAARVGGKHAASAARWTARGRAIGRYGSPAHPLVGELGAHEWEWTARLRLTLRGERTVLGSGSGLGLMKLGLMGSIRLRLRRGRATRWVSVWGGGSPGWATIAGSGRPACAGRDEARSQCQCRRMARRRRHPGSIRGRGGAHE